MNLTTATPVEIDTILAGLYHVEPGLIHGVQAAAAGVRSSAGIFNLALDGKPSEYARPTPVEGTTADAEAILQARVDADSGSYEYSEGAYAARALARLAQAREALAANKAEQAPLHAEFKRRGGWSRSFVAQHAHSSMDCSTCNNGIRPTRFGWLPAVSGMTEAEIVTALGSDACTVCYPTAPVATAPGRSVFTITEQEAIDARNAKAAKRAAKDAKDAADALIDPATGQPIKDTHSWGCKEKAATSEYVDSAAYIAALDDPSIDYDAAGRREECVAFIARFVAAMAAKHGKSEEQVVADLAKKVAARIKRDYR